MGEYFKPMNLDKKEFIDPHSLGSGAKKWEQAAADAPSVGSALIYLLADRWYGDRIVLESDYNSEGHYFDKSFTDISGIVAEWLEDAFDGKFSGECCTEFIPNK